MKHRAAYGSWKSPITPDYVAGKERELTRYVQSDGDDLYFIEARPDEGGRSVLMCRTPDGTVTEVLPANCNVRTRYLEYGGSSYLVTDGVCHFIEFGDQQIYTSRKGANPQRLTDAPGHRFSGIVMDARRNRLIALHEAPATPENRNTICAIDLATGAIRDIVSGADFYLCPQVDPRGDNLLWVEWNHPNMAWNGTTLYTAALGADGSTGEKSRIAGDVRHSVCQPRWGRDGEVYFIAELDDWLNLYVAQAGTITRLHGRNAEFASPDWTPGNQQYALCADGTICAAYLDRGRWQLVRLDRDGSVTHLGNPFPSFPAVCAHGTGVVALVATATQRPALYAIDQENHFTKLYSPASAEIAPDGIALASGVEFPTKDGSTGHAWFYPPTNADLEGTDGEKPPLLVFCHGGPTAMSSSEYRKDFQFWTSRGYALVDVNYGGSTGYGRTYRERLRDNWGVVDVNDCVAVVQQLAREGKIDPARVAIRGGSAGGYTTLAALAFTHGVFAVGASYYGVSELELLAKETHKLESRYLDQLVGPYPEAMALYKERAPIEHVEKLDCPIVFFQGTEDKVVPPNQSELMHLSLKNKSIPTEYHLYEAEGHGFRRSENIQHSLKAEHRFYARFFGFEVQGDDRLAGP